MKGRENGEERKEKGWKGKEWKGLTGRVMNDRNLEGNGTESWLRGLREGGGGHTCHLRPLTCALFQVKVGSAGGRSDHLSRLRAH